MRGGQTALIYHEPSIDIILNLSGFLLVLNIVNFTLDKLLYCGLVGQLFVGVLWGTPGANWLDQELQTVVQKLGYLGLILLVYEGGLSTSLSSLRTNIWFSISVALTGIAAPMGLSFILLKLVGATPLQAFAAGAALSSTSLGTTFTILSTTGLSKSRLGVVTTSAAMLDDVVGLVMVQIIQNLGSSGDSLDPITVVRPVFVSIGFAVGFVLACKFVFKPVIHRILLLDRRTFPSVVESAHFVFVVHTCILVGMVAAATYAGTSSLFAAYLAGALISWFDELSDANPPCERQSMSPESSGDGAMTSSADIQMQEFPAAGSDSPRLGTNPSVSRAASVTGQMAAPSNTAGTEMLTGEAIYERFYKEPVAKIFTPLFFASVGFAIPITELFRGGVVWRGIVYSLLMALSKMFTGLWLVPISTVSFASAFKISMQTPYTFFTACLGCQKRPQHSQTTSIKQQEKKEEKKQEDKARTTSVTTNQGRTRPPSASHNQNRSAPASPSLPPKPKSLYPSSILGLAMVARGEIGYLIASLGESSGIFSQGSSNGSSEIYLVVIWAITICTLVGPICVGTLVRRVKSLQKQRQNNSGSPDPLGIWGI